MFDQRSAARAVRLLFAALLSLSTLSTILSPSHAYAQINSRYVKVDKLAPGRVLWIRAGPGLRSKRIGFLPSTARHIRSLGCERTVLGHWCEIRYRGTRGWASGRYLAADRARRA